METPNSSETLALRPALLGYVRSRVRHAEIAEDIVQDVLLKASQNLSAVKSSAALPGWLFQIARNRVADHFRAARDTVEFQETTHAAETAPPEILEREESVLQQSLNAYIRSVVDGLRPLYRDVLIATEYEGVSQADFARREGISLSTAKSRVQRARALMRLEMERCCSWEADKYGRVLGITPRDCGCA